MIRNARSLPSLRPRNSAPPIAALQAERLVGVGFRCWMTGLDTGDIDSWHSAFTEFAGCVGVDNAKTLMPGLSNWVKAVRGAAQRPIEIAPRGCNRFCRDECLAIAMVAACQHSACPALKACAFTLIGSSNVAGALGAAEEFACGLRRVDQILSPGSICNAAAFVDQQSTLLS
jgi:hypothetical protein